MNYLFVLLNITLIQLIIKNSFGSFALQKVFEINQKASIIALKSATFKEAPPIKPPSISG